MNPECLNCSRLGDCQDTDVEKLKNRYKCDRWEEVREAELQARLVVIQKYGPAAYQALVTAARDEEEEPQ